MSVPGKAGVPLRNSSRPSRMRPLSWWTPALRVLISSRPPPGSPNDCQTNLPPRRPLVGSSTPAGGVGAAGAPTPPRQCRSVLAFTLAGQPHRLVLAAVQKVFGDVVLQLRLEPLEE